MKHLVKILALVAALFAVSGCTWGPCGPTFTRSSPSKDDARKAQLANTAEAVRDSVPAATTVKK